MPEQAIKSLGPAQIDVMAMSRGQLRSHGDVASRLLATGFNINALRTNDILRKEEWLQYDTKLIEIARSRLNGVAAIIGAGLRFDLANALGVTQLQWEQMSDMTDAEVDMSGVTEGQRDRIDFALKSMPIPVVHKSFELNIRLLEASRKLGQPLDTTQVGVCTRKVSEKVESMLFNGSAETVVLGGSIPGLLTEANRKTQAQTADWATASGSQIVGDVITGMKTLQASTNAFYGPYHLFVPYDAYNNMANDYSTTKGDNTILDRVLAIPGISGVTPVVDVPAGSSVMVELSSDVVEEVVGMQPTLVQWESMGGMKFHFKVMAIMVPRVRSTKTGQTGIMHFT